MGILKAYKVWEAKKKASDFNRIKINSSGSFQMKSNDLFDSKHEVKTYVEALNEALNKFNEKKAPTQNPNPTTS